MDTKDRFKIAVKKACKALQREAHYESVAPHHALARLYSSVLEDVLVSLKKGGTVPKAEETAAELIRLGVPKDTLDTTFMRIAIPLSNATFIFHRCQYPPGTVEVVWNKTRCVLRSGLPAKDLARTILDLDPLLPELEPAHKALIDRFAVERKARQVMRVTVKNQLEAVIPAMGIDCRYELLDGVVRLNMTRCYEGHVDVPLAELSAFLADPERIDAVLKPANEASANEIPHFNPVYSPF